MKKLILVIVFFYSVDAVGQNRNSVWCFGDSAGIDFSSGTAQPIISGMVGRGSCVSISNQLGQLQYYAFTRAGIGGPSAQVFDASHQIMQNGDSIIGQGWYQEMIIFPDPILDSTYYLFSIGVTNSSLPGLFYSKIEFSGAYPLGRIIQKNIQLQNFKMVDCLNAVKHGNGRDWWIIFRRIDGPTSPNNDFYTYLITPNGIQNFSVQTIGVLNRTNLAHINFSPFGDKLVFSNLVDLVEIYNFNRCTGQLDNPIVINNDPGNTPYNYTWSSEFSPDASKLYVSTNQDTSYLFQNDLNAPNISASRDTLWSTNYPPNTCGVLKLAPDNKIYLSSVYYAPTVPYFPYADSMYNSYNMNLSVINQPDSLGVACDFQPYSFYLGGKRTYLGLPNNPNYDMPALAGSPCDTLVGISEPNPSIITPQLNIFYHPKWETVFINADKLTCTKGTMEIFDGQGKLVHQEDIQIVNGYYTRNFNMTGMAEGMYVVNLISSRQRLSGKLLKY